MERTNTEMYRISFGPGETEKPCEGRHSYSHLKILYILYLYRSVEKVGCFDLFDQESNY